MPDNKKAKIFTVAQQFPCGPNSCCCGPVGQSEEYVLSLKNAIEKLGLDVEVHDLAKIKDKKENPQALKLFGTFGAQVTPIITIGDEVISMGKTDLNDTIAEMKSKL